MTRTAWRGLALGAALGAGAALIARTMPLDAARANPAEITVYKNASCGCCKMWVQYLQEHGYTVIAHDVDEEALTKLKREKGVPEALESCHTAVIGGYVVEGHVPAADIGRMLREKPKIVGLTVPGMVNGSPGMAGSPTRKYDVLTFDKQGKTTVYSHN